MMVHTGISTYLANEATFDVYVSMQSMESKYLFNREVFKNEAAPKETMNLIQPPIRMALNKDTIYDALMP